MSEQYGPSIAAFRLFEKTSAKGNTYLAGRWGNLRVAVIKSKDVSDTGDAIWNVRLSELPQRPLPSPDDQSKRHHERPLPNSAMASDDIPF